MEEVVEEEVEMESWAMWRSWMGVGAGVCGRATQGLHSMRSRGAAARDLARTSILSVLGGFSPFLLLLLLLL